MYWPDRIWGKVIKKERIAGRNITHLMKIFKTVFGRLCPSGLGQVGFL